MIQDHGVCIAMPSAEEMRVDKEKDPSETLVTPKPAKIAKM